METIPTGDIKVIRDMWERLKAHREIDQRRIMDKSSLVDMEHQAPDNGNQDSRMKIQPQWFNFEQ